MVVNNPKPYSGERSRRAYTFADFTLDVLSGTLRGGDQHMDLRPQSFQVLVHLVERPGSLVTREELMEAVWPDVAVGDESLTRCIADIRKTLADEDQRIIRTVPRRGYVFAVPVTPVVELPIQPVLEALTRKHGRRKHVIAVLLGGLVLLAVVLTFWHMSRSSGLNDQQLAMPLITLPGASRYPSFSPEGDRVVFAWTDREQGNSDVYVQQIGAGAQVRLTTAGSGYNPVWSPDGKWIAFLRRHSDDSSTNDIRLIPALGGLERKLAEIRVPDTYFVIPPYLTWCPDSTCVAATDSPGEKQPPRLWLISVDTGDKRPLTQSGETADTNPMISPDRHWLVFRRQMNGSRLGALYELPLGPGLRAAGEAKQLTELNLDAGYPAWVPGTKEILFSTDASEARGNLWRIAVAGEGAVAHRLPFVGDDGMMPIVSQGSAGRRTRLIYVRSFQDSNIWRILTTGPGASTLISPNVAIASSRRDSTPQLSPDGRRVAFASDRSGRWEIWLADPDGSNPIQLTSLGTASGAPCWSPDGLTIVFQSASPDGDNDVYGIPAAGGKARKLAPHSANSTRPSFSRDGKWIYFTSTRSGDRQIWKIPATGGDPIQVSHNGAFAAFESPDGAYVYYNQTMDTPSPLWRVPASGGAASKILDGVVLGAFAVLDRGIYYIDRPSGKSSLLYLERPSGETRLQYFDLATRKSMTVAHDLGDVFLGLTATRDGRTILYSRVDSSLDELMLVENFR